MELSGYNDSFFYRSRGCHCKRVCLQSTMKSEMVGNMTNPTPGRINEQGGGKEQNKIPDISLSHFSSGRQAKSETWRGFEENEQRLLFTYHFSDSCLKFAKGNYVI